MRQKITKNAIDSDSAEKNIVSTYGSVFFAPNAFFPNCFFLFPTKFYVYIILLNINVLLTDVKKN